MVLIQEDGSAAGVGQLPAAVGSLTCTQPTAAEVGVVRAAGHQYGQGCSSVGTMADPCSTMQAQTPCVAGKCSQGSPGPLTGGRGEGDGGGGGGKGGCNMASGGDV
jgi:hypothetical protein